MTCKVLDNIEPFNEVFYKSCFYDSLFPIISYYKKDILPLLLNDVVVYTNTKINERVLPMVKYLSIRYFEDVIEDMEINIGIYMNTNSIVENIIDSINQNNLIIVCIDCFYNKYSDDTYKKQHLVHTLLAYGYDDNKRIINVIDHINKDSIYYEKRIIDYEDIEEGYRNYVTGFEEFRFVENLKNSMEKPSYFKFSSVRRERLDGDFKLSLGHYREVYCNTVIEKRDIIYNGLMNILKFHESLSEYIFNEKLLEIMMDNIIIHLNHVINAKKSEMYLIAKLFGEQNQLTVLSKDIVNGWSFVRSIIVKYKYSSYYSNEKFMLLLSKIKDIYKEEYKLYSLL